MNCRIAISFILLLAFTSCAENNDSQPDRNAPLFESSSSPIYESPLGIAADPSIIRSNDTLFMYYSAENMIIGVVISLDDGVTWKSPSGHVNNDDAALRGRPDHWDSTLETVDVIMVNSTYFMYYTGYREGTSDNNHVENYEIGLALSKDGLHFERHPMSIDEPIISRQVEHKDTNDRHAMTSPGIVYEDGQFYMIYAGWNVTDDWTGGNAGIRILGATSEDGVNWTKLSKPIINPAEITYSQDVNEASLLRSNDGFWYILFSTSSSIGMARARSFTDTYDIYPEAIIVPEYDWHSEVTAPDGLIEDGTLHLWYHGVKEPDYFPWVIGYATTKYPIAWK